MTWSWRILFVALILWGCYDEWPAFRREADKLGHAVERKVHCWEETQ